MTKIIGLVQVKGGAGRSTVSTNLAGELPNSALVAKNHATIRVKRKSF